MADEAIAQAFVRIRPQSAGFRAETERQVKGALSGVRSIAGPAVAFTGLASAAIALERAGAATISFDRELRNVNSIAQLSENQLSAVNVQLREIGKSAGQSPATVARGLYDIVSSGFQAADALTILRSSTKAATAGLTDTATATSAIDAALNAYHLSAGEASRVSDILFQTVNKGVLTFGELAQNMGDLVPAAAPLGISLPEVASAIAAITLQGVPAAEAATRVKNTMLQLASPSKQLAKFLREQGFASAEAAIKTLGYAGVLERIQKETGGSVSATSKLFPEIRALLGVVGLTGKNAATYADILRSMGQATEGVGATQRAFAEQQKSIGFQFDRVKSQLSSAAIALVTTFFPALSQGATGVGDLAGRLERARPEIQAFERDVVGVARGIGGPLLAAGQAVGRFTAEVTKPIGVTNILAFAAAYKVTTAAISTATAAQARFIAARAAGGAAIARPAATAGAVQAARATETSAVTAALAANTEALAANTAAQVANARSVATTGGVFAAKAASVSTLTVATEANTIAAAENAAANAASGATAVASAGRIATVGRTLSSLAGGPVGIATAAVAVLATGIFILSRRHDEWDRANERTRLSLKNLDGELERAAEIRERLGRATSTATTDRLAVSNARLAVETARQDLATTRAAAGSLEYRQLQINLANAQDQLRTSTENLKRTEQDRQTALVQQTAAETARAEAVRTAAADIQRQAQLQREQVNTPVRTGGKFAGALERDPKLRADAAAASANRFAAALDKQADALAKQNPVGARAARTIAQLTRVIDGIPTRRQISIVVRDVEARKSLKQILEDVGLTVGQAEEVARVGGITAGAALAQGMAAGISVQRQGVFNALTTLIAGARAHAAREAGAAAKNTDNAAAIAAALQAQKAAASAKGELAKAREGLAEVQRDSSSALKDAATAIADAREQLAETIRTAPDQIRDAVQSAKQNLNSIGASLAQSVSALIDKRGGTPEKETSALSAQFKRLRDLISSGNAGPETERAAQALAAKIQADQSKKAAAVPRAGASAEVLQRRFADLTDLLNKGDLTVAQFNARLNRLLAKQRLAPRVAAARPAGEPTGPRPAGEPATRPRRETRAPVRPDDRRGDPKREARAPVPTIAAEIQNRLGVAAADQFRAALAAARAQAREIRTGPQARGTGLEPTVVSPAATARQVAREIATETREVGRRQAALTVTTNDWLAKINAEQKKVTAAATASARAAERARKAEAKAKPAGAAGKRTEDLTRSGARTP